jgi:hypothetical protein
MQQDTQSKIDRLAGILDTLAQVQRQADELMVDIAINGGRGSKAALCRLLEIKPQSFDDRLAAAKNRLAAAENRIAAAENRIASEPE